MRAERGSQDGAVQAVPGARAGQEGRAEAQGVRTMRCMARFWVFAMLRAGVAMMLPFAALAPYLCAEAFLASGRVQHTPGRVSCLTDAHHCADRRTGWPCVREQVLPGHGARALDHDEPLERCARVRYDPPPL